MKKQSIAVLMTLFLSACVSNPSVRESRSPTLNEIQASKPDVFRVDTPSIPNNCTLIPPKVTNIVGTNFYVWSQSDHSDSVIDPVRKAKNDAETQPLVGYSIRLNEASAAYLENKKNVKAGKCIVAYIDEWARNDALLGSMTDSSGINEMPMGRAFQKWMLANAAANYLKVRQLASGDQDARIKWWMTQAAKSVMVFFDNTKTPKSNHYAWAGTAVMEVGILTDNQEFIEWGRKAFNQQMGDISANGSLPTVVARGKRALFYHNHALHTLLYSAQLSKMIGEDWTTNPNLQRLIVFATEANLDPSIMQKLNGQLQYPTNETGWAGLLPDNDPNRVRLAKYGFPNVDYLGGNQQVMRDLIENKKR